METYRRPSEHGGKTLGWLHHHLLKRSRHDFVNINGASTGSVLRPPHFGSSHPHSHSLLCIFGRLSCFI